MLLSKQDELKKQILENTDVSYFLYFNNHFLLNISHFTNICRTLNFLALYDYDYKVLNDSSETEEKMLSIYF